MTAILISWLQEEDLCVENDSVEEKFANGFLLGKLLHKYELQKDFGFFKNSNSSETKLNNFTRLGVSLTQLGVPFHARDARAVMNQEPGAAYSLLYNVYLALQTRAQTGGSQTITYKSCRPELQELERSIYKHQLKQLVPRQSDASMAELVARFEARCKKNMDHAQLQRLRSAELHAQQVQSSRAKLLERSRQLRLAQSELMAKLEANIIDVFKKPTDKKNNEASQFQAKSVTAEGLQALEDLHQFELKMDAECMIRELQSKSQTASELVDQLRLMRAFAKPAEQKQRQLELEANVLDPTASLNYLARIRERVREEEIAQRERQKRRRRIIVASLEEHHAREEERRAQQVTDRLHRQSQLERRLCVQLAQTKREKSVILENRLEKEKEYAAQREIEFQKAMDYGRALALQLKDQEAHALAVLREAWANERSKRRQEAYTRHYNFVARDVVGLMVQFATQVAEYRGLTGRLIPIKLFRQWKAQYIAGKPFWSDRGVQEEQSTANGEDETLTTSEDNDRDQLLDEFDFQDYRKLDGDWKLSNLGKVQVQSLPGEPVRVVFGQTLEWSVNGINSAVNGSLRFDPDTSECNAVFDWLIGRIYRIVYPPPPTPKEPNLPDLPVRLAILGKPFSGKTTMATKLLEGHRCVVINPQNLITEVLDAYRNATEFPTEEQEKEAEELRAFQSSTPSQSAKTTSSYRMNQRILGEKISEQLEAGQELSDELMVELIFNEIKSLQSGMGFVLDGFPSNVQQAQLLEQRLTVAPAENLDDSPVISPNASPCSDPERALKLAGRRSVDLVICLDVSDDEVLRRAVGFATEADSQHAKDEQPDTVITTCGMSKEASYGQVQERLAHFLDTWPTLESFYSTKCSPGFRLARLNSGALVDDQGVEQTVTEDAVFDQIQQLLQSYQLDLMKATEATSNSEILSEDARIPKEQSISESEVMKSESVCEIIVEEQREMQNPNSTTFVPAENTKSQTDSSSHQLQSSSLRQKSAGPSGRSSSEKRTRQKGSGSKRSTGTPNSSEAKHGASASVPAAKSQSRSPSGGGGSTKTSHPGVKSKRQVSAKRAKKDEPIVSLNQTPDVLSPKPGEEGWCYVDVPLEQESAIALMRLYETAEDGYQQNSKLVFRALRHTRWQFIPHLYQARGEFYNYLQRPDSKQAYVTEFQNSFNSVLPEMRADDETKADLHCRVDDLRDTLYELLDETKLANEARIPQSLNPSGWITDKLCLLANLYLCLMQLELTRFQDHVRLIQDYYSVMEKRPQTFENEQIDLLTGTIDATNAVYTRLPLMQLPDESAETDSVGDLKTNSSTSKGQAGRGKSFASQQSLIKSHNASTASQQRNRSRASSSLSDHPSELDSDLQQSSIPANFLTKVTMLHPKASLAEIHAALTKSGPGVAKSPTLVAAPAKGGGKGAGKATAMSAAQDKLNLPQASTLFVDKTTLPTVAEAQFLYNACLCALQIVVNQFQAERQARAAEAEIDGFPIATPKPPGGKANRGASVEKAKSKKVGRKSATPKGKPGKPDETTAPAELSEEERAALANRDRIRKEHIAALEKEASAAIFRLTIIRVQACMVLTELKMKFSETEQLMTDWIGTRTLREHEAVNSLVEFVRNAIELERKLDIPLILEGDRFYLNKVPTTPKDTHESSIAIITSSQLNKTNASDLGFLTLDQLSWLLQKFKASAPLGHIETRAFTTLLQPLVEERLAQLSGPISVDLIKELTVKLARLYQAYFENGTATPHMDAVNVSAKEHDSITDTVSSVGDESKAGVEGIGFYVDWRRFLLAATQSHLVFNPDAKPIQASLIELANRLRELDQSADSERDQQPITMLHVKVTRAQYQFAPFPWYPTNREYYKILQDFIFSVFTTTSLETNLSSDQISTSARIGIKTDHEPNVTSVIPNFPSTDASTTSTKAEFQMQQQTIDCAELLVHLATVGAPNGYIGLLRSIAALLCTPVPNESILGHEEDTLVHPEMEGISESVTDVLIPRSVMEKLLEFGLLNSSPTLNPSENDSNLQLIDAIQPGRFAFREKLRQIYIELGASDGSGCTEAVPLSHLIQHPESVALILSALPRFQLPKFPEPWPSLVRMHAKPDTTGSTSTIYSSSNRNLSTERS